MQPNLETSLFFVVSEDVAFLAMFEGEQGARVRPNVSVHGFRSMEEVQVQASLTLCDLGEVN